MSARLPARPSSKALPPDEPAEAPARRGSLRWVREVLGRSIRLEPPRVSALSTPIGARRGAAAEVPLSMLAEQRAELGARLLVHDPATQAVRHLFVVHDALREAGWPGVSMLPPKVVGWALAEAEILQTQEPSPLLQTLIDSLRKIVAVAEARANEEALQRELAAPAAPEVSDGNYDDYELMERSWLGTVPGGLDPSESAMRAS
jgi:hypothetical protein